MLVFETFFWLRASQTNYWEHMLGEDWQEMEGLLEQKHDCLPTLHEDDFGNDMDGIDDESKQSSKCTPRYIIGTGVQKRGASDTIYKF